LTLCIFFECLSERRDVDVDINLLDYQSYPDADHDLIFGNDLALCGDEQAQNVECPTGETHGSFVAP
jgi:hypothetical protein